MKGRKQHLLLDAAMMEENMNYQVHRNIKGWQEAQKKCVWG